MMAHGCQLLVFGDQAASFAPGLRRLLQVKNNNALVSFFERTQLALRQEIARLPVLERKLFPRFANIHELLHRYQEDGSHPALESALTCLYQLACCINYYGVEGHQYPSATDTYVVGLCIGSLAAAALSSTRSLGELISTGIDAVLVALKVGLCTLKAASLVEANALTSAASWSAVIPASAFQPETIAATLSDFNHEHGLPSSSILFISAVGLHSVTISGPPSVLERFLQHDLPSDVKPTKIPIHAPYHAPHLYLEEDLDDILGAMRMSVSEVFTPKIPVISSSTGNLVVAATYSSLLRGALTDMLVGCLDWSAVLEKLRWIFSASNLPSCTIIPISTAIGPSLASSLGQSCEAVLYTGIMEAIDLDPRTEAPSGRPEHSKIAIIGMSGRFPEAADTEQFWDLLHKGLDVHRMVPPDRFDAVAHYDASGQRKNTSKILNGCWINEPGLFDARFFNVSPKEAAQADPGQRLALQTAYEALEMAGIVPDRTPSTQRDRVGVFYGMTSDDWREVNSGQEVDTYFIPGGNRAFTPGRLNYFFKFSGPSVSVDTACSSSLAAIHMACNSLWQNDCDTAIAGGTNVMTNPDNFAGLDRGHFLSTTGNCHTFDDGANGYCRADGVGTVILKRLEDAQADRDPILAIILGAYTNHSAESVSITRPHSGAQAFIFSKLINEANVHPHDVSYIEMHGTGTQAGDGAEMSSVLEVFAPDHKRKPYQSLHLGSAKANVGHGESASGVTALIKVLLMMQKNLIPPHCGIKTHINHQFPTDLKERNVHIAMRPTPWNRPDEGKGKRRTFVNNFSAAGGNTALLLEDATLVPLEEESPDPRSVQLIALSAKSAAALKNNVRALKLFMEKDGPRDDNLLTKLSYTTTARRMHHPYRIMLCSSITQEAIRGLDTALAEPDVSPARAANMRLGFVFSGQGAQYVGMGQHLFQHISQFRSDVMRFDSIAKDQGYPSFLPLIDGTARSDEICPLRTQLGTTCLQMALARFWISLGVEPSFVLGHSLGEYAALSIAGVLNISDTIYLTGLRARLLKERCQAGSHSMLAVKSTLSELSKFLDDQVHEIACINGPQEIVIGGKTPDIDQLAESNGFFKSLKINVPYAFHSAQVDLILDSFEESAKRITFHKPKIPIISPLLGDVITEDNADLLGPNYLRRHCREAVNFMGGLSAARTVKLITDKTAWIEIGPHTVCSSFLKSNLGSQVMALPSLRRNEDGWKVLAGSLSALYLAGANIRWDEYHRDFSSCQQVLPLPAYSWDSQTYWIQYVHDWTLTKGDAPSVTSQISPASQVSSSTFSTTSVQRIIEEYTEGSTVTIVMQSDFAHPLLAPVARGHRVNGARLCPSSLYADIGQTLGNYLLQNYRPEMKHYGIDVRDMVVDQALIINDEAQKLFRATVTFDLTTTSANMSIYSIDDQGKKTINHAQCTLQLADCSSWVQEWERNAYLVQRSVEWLQKGAGSHRIRTGMAYKLFSSLVDYSQDYKAMQEVVLDSESFEATALVKLQANEGNFHRNPFWIDSLGHLSGFVMNANDATPAEQVFVNHGWESMRCSRRFSASSTYRNYVRMKPIGGNKYSGDVFIFEDQSIVAVYGGVTFQGIPRRVLDMVLPPDGMARAPASVQPRAPVLPAMTLESQRLRSVDQATVTHRLLPLEATRPVPSFPDRVLGIISQEIGLVVAELSDDLIFADFGVDSLLSLTITGRIREELDFDVATSLFSDYGTLGELKKFLSRCGSLDQDDSSNTSSYGNDSPQATTPEKVEDDDNRLNCKKQSGKSGSAGPVADVCRILSEETGISADDLYSSSGLAELGMDSLLSLTVLGRLREELDIDLPMGFFATNSTVGAIRQVLGPEPTKTNGVFESEKALTIKLEQQIIAPPSHYRATSILLQGNPMTAQHVLFLFPDGSGSATSYAALPPISSTVCVYGLNCPWLKSPKELVTYGLTGLTSLYVAEIRRRRPRGPYNVGGWSAGGICAYEAAMQLTKDGERVDRLILLDSPGPIGLEKLPPRLYDFLDTLGLFGEGSRSAPEWLLSHFLAFIDALDAYNPVPWRSFLSRTGNAHAPPPKTYMIWATDGVCKYPDDARPELRDDDPREMRWLLENRTDFGPNSWDILLGKENLVIERIDEANHFTMLQKGRNAGILADFLGKGFQSA